MGHLREYNMIIVANKNKLDKLKNGFAMKKKLTILLLMYKLHTNYHLNKSNLALK